MDQSQDLAWWASVVFDRWRDRPGPRYQRLAACLLDAVSRRVLVADTRVPAERQLAMVVGVSRGTVVACFEHLVAAGVLRRRVGAGTYVVGAPSWATSVRASGGSGAVTELLLRRLAGDLPVIDLSVSCPGDVRHLPPSDEPALASLDGNGLDPHGLLSLRIAVASHLTRFGRLPTAADQIVICAGAQEALWLLGRVLRPPRVLASCPTYPGLTGAFGSRLGVVPGDGAGTTAVEVARAPGGSCAFVMPDGHNPTGLVMSGVRRQAFASVADAERIVVIEDMALADLSLSGGALTALPLASLSPCVIAVGSVSKLLWGGLRIGWIRVGSSSLLEALVTRKASLNLATSAVAQAYAAGLLGAVTASWLAAHRAALVRRRDHLVSMVGTLLPAWRVEVVPSAGLSLWVRLPVLDAAAFAHVASRHGVEVAPGSAACVCGAHRGYVRLSFAEHLDTLSLAVERLAVAWEAHSENLAAGLVSLAAEDAGAVVPGGAEQGGAAGLEVFGVGRDALLGEGFGDQPAFLVGPVDIGKQRVEQRSVEDGDDEHVQDHAERIDAEADPVRAWRELAIEGPVVVVDWLAVAPVVLRVVAQLFGQLAGQAPPQAEVVAEVVRGVVGRLEHAGRRHRVPAAAGGHLGRVAPVQDHVRSLAAAAQDEGADRGHDRAAGQVGGVADGIAKRELGVAGQARGGELVGDGLAGADHVKITA